MQQNTPELWLDKFPKPAVEGHKYHRGYAAICGAPSLTGATRLAAMACSRIGAGLVTVLADENADIYKVSLPPDIMVHPVAPEKVTVMLGGPGGIGKTALHDMLTMQSLKARVFDADALLQIRTFKQLDENCVLTPHFGEFQALFGPVEGDLSAAVRKAATVSGATIVLKQHETIIANPYGRLVVNTHTSPYLAKAGTGDVLAGLITGLLAQGLAPFEAACTATWIHGDAGFRLGAGLVASDLPGIIPEILQSLLS